MTVSVLKQDLNTYKVLKNTIYLFSGNILLSTVQEYNIAQPEQISGLAFHLIFHRFFTI